MFYYLIQTFIKKNMFTDASCTQLGTVIVQEGKPLPFYSSPAKTHYTSMEQELLSIVEILKEFRNILFCQQIEVFTNHLNLTCKEFNTERVMRWHLLIEDFGPTITYMNGQHNLVTDALSGMNRIDEGIKPERVNNKMDGKVRDESRKSFWPVHICNVTLPRVI